MAITKKVPAQIRTFADTLMGDRSTITEKNFTPEELQQIKNSINNSRARQATIETPAFQKGIAKARKQLQGNPEALSRLEKMGKIDPTVGYQDYGNGERGKRVENDFNLGGSGAIRNTLGRFAYEKTPDGRLIATDTYDFKDDLVKEAGARPSADYEKMNTLEKIGTLAKDTVTTRGGLTSIPSRIGSAFIGKNGRPVAIDLGKADFKKGGSVKAKPKNNPKPKISKASSRGDGCAQRGKTRGKLR
jgi:hypothetical protein